MADQRVNVKRVGLWLNDKKAKRFPMKDFHEACRERNMELVIIDLDKPLTEQGPFHIVLHKLSGLYALVLDGNIKARHMANRLEKYMEQNQDVPMVDPLPGVHTLIHRSATYALLYALTRNDLEMTTPPYVELPDMDIESKKQMLEDSGVRFPIVCKPVFGCGGTAAHELAVVLSSSRLSEWQGPCVAQSFVPHGAVLYKLYVIGDNWHLVVRPSLKNFRASDSPTVYFNSAKVSKAGSCSPLTQLDHGDRTVPIKPPDHGVLERIVSSLRSSLSMDLIGLDVVIDSVTGQYTIIDINPFPSYDSIIDFLPSLTDLLVKKINSNSSEQRCFSSMNDLLLPIEYDHDGMEVSHKMVDSNGLDVNNLLEKRGLLDNVYKLTNSQRSPVKNGTEVGSEHRNGSINGKKLNGEPNVLYENGSNKKSNSINEKNGFEGHLNLKITDLSISDNLVSSYKVKPLENNSKPECIMDHFNETISLNGCSDFSLTKNKQDDGSLNGIQPIKNGKCNLVNKKSVNSNNVHR